MYIFSVIRDYLVWHYSSAYIDMLYIWRNYFWFVNHLLSVPEVVKSLFDPLKRLQEERVNILKDPEKFFSNLTVNVIMRIVGFVLRSAIIIIAFVLFLIVFILGIALCVIWTLLPILVGHFLITGIKMLIS